MIDTPQIPENSNNNISPDKNELLDNLQKNTKIFFRKLEFSWLDYEAKREKVENITDELVDFLYKEKIHQRNILMNLFKEIIKNSADHSWSDMHIHIELDKSNDQKKANLRFLLYDKWPGIPYESNYIKYFFDTGKSPSNREKKGNNNFWIWLGLIKAVSQQCNIDLILHNQWNIIHLNNLGLQKDVKPQKNFWYEGLGTFDIIEK